ncbi:MAG: molybdopterin-dependent oxidoreductase [Chloroflexi bacterium]|nr:molybdopterin-dependent oxidoreductase [Chloroflexota bacterium]
MKLSRRTLLKGSAATGGALLAARVAEGGLETLVSARPESQAAPVEESVPTTCWIGKQDCGILARRVGGRVVKLEGHPLHPRNRGRLCPKGVAQIVSLYDPNRVKAPLIRTNEKGKPGTWRQASWDEALTLVGERIKEVRARDKRLLLWQKGRSKAEAFYDNAFVTASGATKLHHGAFCSDAGYRAAEYTIGPNGVLHPDFRYTRHVLAWGWNITNAGGNKLCWITWPQQLGLARERGVKVVAIDPRQRGAAHFADQWLPIRPGTDLALALALAYSLVSQDDVDRDYLTRHTNAPFLVQKDGSFLRLAGKEQVWDQVSKSARPFDAQDVRPALEGAFTVGGQSLKPAFQLLKEHLTTYTPEWAARICDLPTTAIWSLANELGETAQLGSTIVVDGVQVPYRPVSVMAYHMAQQELGFQALRAIMTVFMLLGAVGAAGGVQVDLGGWKLHSNFKALDEIKIQDPPYNVYLKDSRFFPINSNNSALVAKVMLDPAKYGVDYTPEVLVLHMTNPVLAYGSQPDIIESYKRFKFVVAIDPWLSETADYFADVVLPAATMEKYEGPLSVGDPYSDAVTVRLPVMAPLYQSRGDIDIYLDLSEKAGLLYGPGGYLDALNKALKLKDNEALPLDAKPAVRDIFERWARSQGLSEGLAYFERQGVKLNGSVPPRSFYGYAMDPPFGGVRHRLYGEALLRYRTEMQARGAGEVYWRDYTPFPTWRAPTMDSSPRNYDLYLISYKLVEFKQSRSAFNPLLAELQPEQRLEINPTTARARGINEGDLVWVESHHALTGETRKVQVKASYRASIRPDTVGMPHHYGNWSHPSARGQGPTPNALFFTGEGYVANTADQSFHVKVRVYK